MSNPNLKPSLRAAVIAVIPSASHSVGTATTAGAVDMSEHITAHCVCAMGALGGGVATLKWEQATVDDFSDAKAVEGRDPIDLAENLPAQLNLKANELDINGGFRYVRPVITVTVAAVQAGAVVLAHDAKHQPADPMTGAVVD